MKVIYNKIIPFKGYKAINLFSILFVRNGEYMSDKDFNHEAIHSAQMKELLWLPFYIIYGIEWLIRWCMYKFDAGKAYDNISFEREAYFFQGDFDYLNRRKHYKQFHMLM